MPFKRQISPKQAAQALDVSEASVKRWCDRGLLIPTLTAGGHRRIAVAEVLRFVRARGANLVRPEILGLPSTTGGGDLAFDRASEVAADAFCEGDADCVRKLFLNLYLGGRTTAEIADLVVAPAFARVGDRWEHGQVTIHQERRAVELCQQAMYSLDSALPPPLTRAPIALGGVLEGDPYVLGSKWCAVALHEAGWRAESYGNGLPSSELAAAIHRRSPKLVWLSVSSRTTDAKALTESIAIVRAAADAVGAVLVCGGSGVGSEAETSILPVRHCKDLRQLVALATGVLGMQPVSADADSDRPVRRRKAVPRVRR